MSPQYTIETICAITGGQLVQQGVRNAIDHLVYDSRAISYPASSLFLALGTVRQDGHLFIEAAYNKGVRTFIVAAGKALPAVPDATVIEVADVVLALQRLATHHRQAFSIPIIGITGSNGKTIVKEWLYHLLHLDYKIARSPRSFNSQMGVPLSVWGLHAEHTLGIFEAGISLPGEMQKLEAIIKPTIGVLTNIGEAHSEGFASAEQKLSQKMLLFKNAEVIVGPYGVLKNNGSVRQVITWGYEEDADLVIRRSEIEQGTLSVELVYKDKTYSFQLPFADKASLHNAVTCITVLLYLGYEEHVIDKRLKTLPAIDMRLQLKHGINNCTIINDSYSADLTSLNIALHFLAQQQTAQHRTVILSDFAESGKEGEELYKIIGSQLGAYGVKKVIAIGNEISKFLPAGLTPSTTLLVFSSAEEFLSNFPISEFANETILIKGSRKAGFERIVQALEIKVHQTQLDINLSAVAHNLAQYRKLLKPATKVMAMVKAFSYGSGTSEIASVLQFHKIDYLGVAYADEGVVLRKAGISVPIMVMNADDSTFGALVEHNLQPVLYSYALLQQFENYLTQQGLQHYPVHLEVETGMNRLGFDSAQLKELKDHFAHATLLKIESVFTHLAAAEDPAEDSFTQQQARLFSDAANALAAAVPYKFLQHVANSAAALRHPHLHMDMIRLGIGLYGVEINTEDLHLQPVATLRSTVAQLKHLKKGESVSYNRRGVVSRDSVIATIRIGYADGYSRRLGNGKGKVWVGGKVVPVIGTVCMDMTMIDVTDVSGITEGDEVIVFGASPTVQQVAEWADTIPYEIMTSISQRVKRVYYQE